MEGDLASVVQPSGITLEQLNDVLSGQGTLSDYVFANGVGHAVIAKLVCNSKEERLDHYEQLPASPDHKGGEPNYDRPVNAAEIKMGVVYRPPTEDDPGKNSVQENRIFGDATPSGQVAMFIRNPNAHGAFKAGKLYYAVFVEAVE